jgi:hypothetical protein
MAMSNTAAAITAATAGALGWLLLAAVGGRREAWDSAWYFSGFFPLLGLLVGGLAFLAPGHPWRIAFAAVGGQAAVAVVQNPTGGLLPVGLIAFALLGSIYMVPASAGAWLRRRLGGGPRRSA